MSREKFEEIAPAMLQQLESNACGNQAHGHVVIPKIQPEWQSKNFLLPIFSFHDFWDFPWQIFVNL